MPNAARLRISLANIEPEPWRRIEVPVSLSLKGLHDCIQAAFLWHNSHLWEFDIAECRYSDVMEDFGAFDSPDDKVNKASSARLSKMIESGVEEFLYVYDMGDDWAHLIEVEALFDADPATKYPCFLDGQWAAPPEDCGGPPGFEEFREIMANPRHPEHRERLDWHGGPFDPAFINQEQIAILMNAIARRRRTKP